MLMLGEERYRRSKMAKIKEKLCDPDIKEPE